MLLLNFWSASVDFQEVSGLGIVIAPQAVLVRFCGLKSPSRRTAAAAIASNSAGAAWPAVANAQAVLARFCGLKSASCRTATAAIASNSAGAA